MVTSRQILFAFILLSLSVLFAPENASAYYVSGVIDLNYRGYESEYGGAKTSYHTWSESVQTSFNGYVLDPRLVQISAGAGYTAYSNSNAADSRLLNYNLYTTILPGMKVSWDLYGSQSINTVRSEANIAGYDVTNTTYGSIVYFAPNKKVRGGNRNNNNNNNNGNNRSGRAGLIAPDIELQYNHSESESLSSTNPLHETRDDSKAKFAFNMKSGNYIDVDAARTEYENLMGNSSYQDISVNMRSKFKMSSKSNLSLDGYIARRDGEQMADYFGDGRSHSYNAILDFIETDGLRHTYRYSFAQNEASGSDTTSEVAEAQAQYVVSKEFRISAGLNHSFSETIVTSQTITIGAPQTRSKLETGGLIFAANYLKTYKPAFLGPFSLNTNYDINAGFSKLASPTDSGLNGDGLYYSNAFGFGIPSTGWEQDNLAFDYSFYSKRDHSPLDNDILQHQFRTTASTLRIPRTILRAVVSYLLQENNSTYSVLSETQNSNQDRRAFTYDFTASYNVTSNWEFRAGAARTESKSTSYTLAEMPADPSVAKTYNDLYFTEANFKYMLRRNLQFRTSVRDELRDNDTADSRDYQLSMNLDYRFRQASVNLEYRYRQDIYEENPRSTQQYYYAKISRPF